MSGPPAIRVHPLTPERWEDLEELMAEALLRAAVEHARAGGAGAVEGYPVDAGGPAASASLSTGVPGMFLSAGFREVARRRPGRPIMRREL